MNSGTPMTVEELMDGYSGVKTMIQNGGITATGGEPLLQMDFLIDFFTEAKKQNINTCLDTSGITFDPGNVALMKRFDALMRVTDIVMLDIKHIDNDEHIKLTGHSNRHILEFLEYMSEWRNEGGRQVEIWIRHVVVPGITLDDEYLSRLGYELGRFRIKALDILPYHDMAKTKYEKLNRPYPLADTPPASREQAKHARSLILDGIRKYRLSN